MTRAVGRAVAAGLLGALAAVVWLALFYGLRPALTVDLRASLPRLLSGIYPGERDPVSGGTFAWTGEQVTLRLPGLDRRVPWQVRLRVRGGRQAASDNPTLTFSADGLALESIATTTAFQEVTVTIPVQPDRRGLTLGIRSSATVVPGGSDPRALGVILERVQLVPTGIVVPPRAAFAGAAASAAAMGAGVAMVGVTAGSAIGAAILLAAAIARTVAVGFGPYTDYPAARRPDWVNPRNGPGARRADRQNQRSVAISQHSAVRRDRIRRGAPRQAARAAPSGYAGRGRAVPRPPVPAGARRKSLLHVDRARQLPLSVRARALRAGVRRGATGAAGVSGTWRCCASSPPWRMPRPGHCSTRPSSAGAATGSQAHARWHCTR